MIKIIAVLGRLAIIPVAGMAVVSPGWDRGGSARPAAPARIGQARAGDSATPRGPSAYAALVARYRSGEFDPAVIEISGWSRSKVRDEAVLRNLPDDVGSYAACVLLHTEAGALHLSIETTLAHFEVAEGAIARLKARRFDPGFRRTWYLLAASCLFGRDASAAGRLLNFAWREFPNHPEVLLAQGSWYESRLSPAGWSFSDVSRVMEADKSAIGLARMRYLPALAADPELHEARLRLGRVFSLSDKPDLAVPDLERVRRDTTKPYLWYLATLFLARAHENAGRAAEATRLYESALEAVPTSQAPALALAHLQFTAGQTTAAARTLLRAMQTLPAGSAVELRWDPWWMYDLGQAWQASARLLRLREAIPR